MITARGLNSASQIAHGTARMSSFENAHCSSILIFSSILVNHRGFAVVSPWWPALGRHGLAGLAGGVLEGPLDLRKARHRQLENCYALRRVRRSLPLAGARVHAQQFLHPLGQRGTFCGYPQLAYTEVVRTAHITPPRRRQLR